MTQMVNIDFICTCRFSSAKIILKYQNEQSVGKINSCNVSSSTVIGILLKFIDKINKLDTIEPVHALSSHVP